MHIFRLFSIVFTSVGFELQSLLIFYTLCCLLFITQATINEFNKNSIMDQ